MFFLLILFFKTLDEIARQEHNIQRLKNAIREKEAPMKVSQTRLHDRSVRPGIELCRDPAHTQYDTFIIFKSIKIKFFILIFKTC